MCKPKPGPRCSGHSLTKFEAAVERAHRTGSPADRSAALVAEDEFDTTPAGQARLSAIAKDPLTPPAHRVGYQARLAAAAARRRGQVAAYKEITGKTVRGDGPGDGDQETLGRAVPGVPVQRKAQGRVPAVPAPDPDVYEFTASWPGRDGLYSRTTRFRRIDPEAGVHLDYFDSIRVQADRPLTKDESERLAQLTGYAAVQTMGQGEGFGDPTRDTDSSIVLGADVTKFAGRKSVGDFPDQLLQTVSEGTPVRKTDRAGTGTKGTRLVEGIPGVKLTLWADSVWVDPSSKTGKAEAAARDEHERAARAASRRATEPRVGVSAGR